MKADFFKKADIWIFLILLALAGLTAIPHSGDSGSRAVVTVGRREVLSIDLMAAKEGEYPVPETSVVLMVKQGRIAFQKSDCRNKLCRKSGWLSKGGQTAACLPEGVVVTIWGGDDFGGRTY